MSYSLHFDVSNLVFRIIHNKDILLEYIIFHRIEEIIVLPDMTKSIQWGRIKP